MFRVTEEDLRRKIEGYIKFLNKEGGKYRNNSYITKYMKDMRWELTQSLKATNIPAYQGVYNFGDWLDSELAGLPSGNNITEDDVCKQKLLIAWRNRFRTLIDPAKACEQYMIENPTKSNDEFSDYNTECIYFPHTRSTLELPDNCKCDMEMLFCSSRCAYAKYEK